MDNSRTLSLYDRGGYDPAAADVHSIIKQKLGELSAAAKTSGMDDGDVLSALGKTRETMDPFGMFCEVHGALIKAFGSLFILILETVAVLVLIQRVIETSNDFFKWIKDNLGTVFTIAAIAGGAVALGPMLFSLFDRDEETSGQRGLRLGGAAIKGFIIGLFPGPLQGALMAVAVEAGSGLYGVGPGGVAGPPVPTEEDGGVEEYDIETLEAVADLFKVPVNDVISQLSNR